MDIQRKERWLRYYGTTGHTGLGMVYRHGYVYRIYYTVLTRATQAAGKVLQALMVLAQDCVRRPLGAPTRT